MADVPGKFFSATKVRTGVSPSSPGSLVGEPLPPVNPPGGGLNSVGLTMPSAFTVDNSPLTSNGTIGVTGAGTVGQYIRGDGSLADFPESSGGGSSISYYLNGSISQGTIGGVAYKELNKVPILGAGTDFTINADGYIASFITDAGDPNLLEIPGGNWTFETYFSASSGGGSPTFYVELYKYDGTTFTLIASNSTFPEFIAFGTNITAYFTTLAVPTTTLALTDRLAVRYYVTHSGRTITMHTEGPHLCQIITTFTTGLTALNGLTAQVQNFAVGTTGTDFNIASAVSTHTFNLPTASATNRGALSSADWTTFNNKTSNLGTVTSVGLSSATSGVTIGSTPVTTSGTITLAIATASGSQNGLLSSTDWTTFNAKQNALTLTTTGSSGAATLVGTTLNIPNYGSALTGYVPYTGATSNVALGIYSLSLSNLSVNNILANNDGLNDIGSLAGNKFRNVYASSFVKTGGTSSEYLKADGSVSTLTNPITGTGTGTTNYLPKFTGTSTIGNSLFTDNGINGAIGGENYYAGTGVRTFNISASLYPGLVFWANNTTTGSIFSYTFTGNLFLSADPTNVFNDSKIAFDVDGGERLAIFGNGNVSISNSPADNGFKFDVSGTGRFTSNLTASSFIRSGGTSSQFLKADGSVDSTTYVPTSRTITINGTTQDLSADRTYNVGTVTSVTASSPLFSSGGTTPNITIQQASGSQSGFLSSTDWTTFNNKAPSVAGGYLPLSGGTLTGNLNLKSDGGGVPLYIYGRNSDNSSAIFFYNETGVTLQNYILSSPTDFRIVSQQNAPISFVTNAASSTIADMTITSGGDVLIGLNSATAKLSVQYSDANNNGISINESTSAANSFLMLFRSNNVNKGSIQTNSGNTGVLYNTTSDYRFKEDLKDYSGIEIVSKIKTYDFKWKNSEFRSYGVLAHELQELIPDIVGGLKDKIDKNGEIIPQGVDYGKLTPILIKAIQELKQEIDTLKN